MSKQTHSQLVLCQAERIAKGVPPDLPALQILQRPTVGPTVRLCAVGDIGLSGRAAATAKRWGADTLFTEVAPVLQAADITFGNLESPSPARLLLIRCLLHLQREQQPCTRPAST